jgi:hypothetical protein
LPPIHGALAYARACGPGSLPSVLTENLVSIYSVGPLRHFVVNSFATLAVTYGPLTLGAQARIVNCWGAIRKSEALNLRADEAILLVMEKR